MDLEITRQVGCTLDRLQEIIRKAMAIVISRPAADNPAVAVV
jgi:hypothetical protein